MLENSFQSTNYPNEPVPLMNYFKSIQVLKGLTSPDSVKKLKCKWNLQVCNQFLLTSHITHSYPCKHFNFFFNF